MHTISKNESNPGFKIIQITDCHLLENNLSKFKNVSPAQSLQQVCKSVLQKHADADLLLLTGDLSQDGSAKSYSNLLDLIPHSSFQTYALAGNHDAPELMHSILSPGINLEKSCRHKNWCLLFLHSAVANEVSGTLEKEELLWLKQQLDSFSKQHVMLAIHHHPVATGSQWMDKIGLRNSSELNEVIREYANIRLLVHGHTHQANSSQIHQIPCYGTPSSWRQFVTNSRKHQMDVLPPAYRVIELFDNGTHRSWIEFTASRTQ